MGQRLPNHSTVVKSHRQSWVAVQGHEFECLTDFGKALELRAVVFAWHYTRDGKIILNVFVRATWLVDKNGNRTDCKVEIVPGIAALQHSDENGEYYAEVKESSLELV